MNFRIGIGIDAHRIESGRRLVLGGVDLAAPFGLAAHSDGDVICHALIDALLGAASLGDKGRHFPPTDPAFRDADSKRLLQKSVVLLRNAGWRVVNVDVSVMCEEPKLAPHIESMRRALGPVLDIEADAVSIKGTTLEQMGFTGRKEGIAALAVALIEWEEV